jgi:hypothetical protein
MTHKLQITIKSPTKDIDLKDLVQSMRHNDGIYELKCINEMGLLKKYIYRKKYLSSNKYGQLLQEYIKHMCDIGQPLDKLSGDGNKNGKI